MKVLVAVPTFETITPETFRSIYNLKRGEHDVSFDFVKGYDCAKARNEIAKKTTEGGYDAVLMVDSDIIVPDMALLWMTETPADIVLGCYPRKNTKKGEVELFRLGQKDFVNRYTYEDLPQDTRIDVKGGGFGCAFVNSVVFKQLPFPWFKYVTYNNGSVLSEDLYFCHSAITAMIRVQADTRIRCGHLIRGFQYN